MKAGFIDDIHISSGSSTISGTPTSSSNVKLAGEITAQTSVAINTLNLDSHDVALGSGQTLTVNGILQSGGSATISGGNGITYGGSGGETDLVIRTDTESDFLIISNSIFAPNLTKSGEGVLLLSGSNDIGGTTAINSGVLVAANNSALGLGSVTVKTGGILVAASGVTLGNVLHLQGGLYAKTVDSGGSFNLKAASQFSGGRDTTAEILGGIASSDTSLENMFWETSDALNDTLRLTDVYSFQGTGSDIFVLQLSISSLNSDSYLGWLDADTGSDTYNQWINAVEGNSGGTPTFFARGYNAATDFHLGYYGVDVSTGSAWAVLDHNSDFTIIPEPSTWGLLMGASLVLLNARRRRQTR